jgi:hypothetical protein
VLSSAARTHSDLYSNWKAGQRSNMNLTKNPLPHRKAHEARVFFILLAASISLAFSICCYLKNLTILPPGPAVAISEVTKSLWESGSLSPEYFKETYREASGISRTTSTNIWQDVFAVDEAGNLLPKHSLISAVIAVPFYALFGTMGFWIVQQIFFLWLLSSSYSIVEELTQRALPWTTLLATCFFSQTIFYSFEFNYDLHGCALFVGGFNLMRHRPFFGGAVMCLSIFTRPTYFILVLPLAFARKYSAGFSNTLKSLLGLAVTLALFLLVNDLLWGSPFLVSYSRLPSFHNGQMIIAPHPLVGDLETFIRDWSSKLLSSKGLIPYNLAFLAFPFVLLSIWRHREWRFQLVCLLTGLGYSLYIFSYPMWAVTYYGNRFLLPAIYLYLIPFMVYLGALETRLTSGPASEEARRDLLMQ